jgi:hypothetical protein
VGRLNALPLWSSVPWDGDQPAIQREYRLEAAADIGLRLLLRLTLFKPERIERWLHEGDGTALCLACGIDSALGSASAFPISQSFLEERHRSWFGT